MRQYAVIVGIAQINTTGHIRRRPRKTCIGIGIIHPVLPRCAIILQIKLQPGQHHIQRNRVLITNRTIRSVGKATETLSKVASTRFAGAIGKLAMRAADYFQKSFASRSRCIVQIALVAGIYYTIFYACHHQRGHRHRRSYAQRRSGRGVGSCCQRKNTIYIGGSCRCQISAAAPHRVPSDSGFAVDFTKKNRRSIIAFRRHLLHAHF